MESATTIVSDERRAVVKIGDSLTMSLPARWARDNGVRPGKRRLRVVRFGEFLLVRPAAEEAEAEATTPA